MRLIVTRPEPDCVRTAQALVALGHAPILSPALQITPTRADLPSHPVQAVLATSVNAVRMLAAHPQRARIGAAPVLAVGDATALAARRAGFTARSAGGDMADLAALICAEFDSAAGPLLYAAGADRAGDLPGELAGHRFAVETVALYEARPLLRLSLAAADALRADQVDGVLLYSKRSAAAFALALRAERLAPLASHVACFCLSQAVAEPLRAISTGRLLVAARPDQISLFALIESAACNDNETPV